jgi:hypothetical protein
VRSSATAPVVVIALVVLVLVACADLPGTDPLVVAITVQNRTSTPLTFQTVVGDDTYDLRGPIPAGAEHPIISFRGRVTPNLVVDEDGCTRGHVIAYDPDGREVARHAPSLCIGETWVIADEP